MRRMIAALGLLGSLCLSAPSAAQTRGEPSWDAARAAIEAWYKEQLPDAKTSDMAQAETREIDELGIKVRYFARLTVRRADGLRDRDHVNVLFARVAGKWEVERANIMGSDPLPEVDPPSQANAMQLFRDVWKKDKCEGYDITGVKIEGEPRFQRELVSDRVKAKRWFIYQLEISATGNGDFKISEEGKPYELSIQNLLLWDPAGKSWSVDPRHVKCSGFIKKK